MAASTDASHSSQRASVITWQQTAAYTARIARVFSHGGGQLPSQLARCECFQNNLFTRMRGCLYNTVRSVRAFSHGGGQLPHTLNIVRVYISQYASALIGGVQLPTARSVRVF